MLVVSPALNDPRPLAASIESSVHDGEPCAFKGCSGFYHAAGGSTGVVLCSPWGFEDLTMRKSWRLLAEAIARAGYPCIRFDYPGTGNSLRRATEVEDWHDWTASIHAAADALRLYSGARRFVFIGQSLGATLAAEAARARPDVVALQLIAPVVKGRAYVRELAATQTLVADRIGIKLELAQDESLAVLGFTLSRKMAESLKALDLTKIDGLEVRNVTVFDQPDRKAGAEAIEHMRRLGLNVASETVEPFHLMVSDATAIQPLPAAAEAVVAALRSAQPAAPAPIPTKPNVSAAIVGNRFREEPVRFGPDDSLFGVLCRPTKPRADAPVVLLLNRGLNPHIGWRRVSVDHARGLAAAGFTSLRIDVAGLGESRDAPGRPVNLIYSDLLIADIGAAVDFLVARGHGRIAVAGVCSGAYMALQAAQVDTRITDLIVVNTQRFLWYPAENVDDVIRYGLRSMTDYFGDVKSGNALKKLWRSRKRLVPAMLFLLKRSGKNTMANVPLGLRSLVLRNSMAAKVDRLFSTLAARGVRVSLVYAENDPGLIELRAYFGEGGRNMRFPNVSITMIPDSDHNLTTTRACDMLLDHMISFSAAVPREDARLAVRAGRQQHRAVCPT